MKVWQLIEQLRRLPQDAVVVIKGEDSYLSSIYGAQLREHVHDTGHEQYLGCSDKKECGLCDMPKVYPLALVVELE